jgi:hypothetical protein
MAIPPIRGILMDDHAQGPLPLSELPLFAAQMTAGLGGARMQLGMLRHTSDATPLDRTALTSLSTSWNEMRDELVTVYEAQGRHWLAMTLDPAQREDVVDYCESVQQALAAVDEILQVIDELAAR